MPQKEEYEYSLPVEDFDASLLPPHARQPGTDAFRNEVSKAIQKDFEVFGGWVQIVVDARTIRVAWRSDPNAPAPLRAIANKIEKGEFKNAISALQHLRLLQPDNANVFFNLGITLSDLGELQQAEKHLRYAVLLAPTDTNHVVALGVVLARQGRYEEAVTVLEQAVAQDVNNPWAQRNLGACLLQIGRIADAERHLRRAVELNPSDQNSVLGLGQALEAGEKFKEADVQYAKVIDLDSRSALADTARDARSQLAQKSFRNPLASVPRPDAVMYLFGALKKFEKMTEPEVEKITYEIAILGQRGFDTNDPTPKYQLKGMPGQYSGLHLVCLMFVGVKLISPERSIGFDLEKEYELAKQM